MTADKSLHIDIAPLNTMLDMVRWSVSQFNQAELYFGHGTDNPWDEAVALVLHALHLPHSITQQAGEQIFFARLTESEKMAVVDLVTQRIDKRLPLAYLTNQAWFCGLPFYVDERVLVPRSPFAELITSKFEAFIEQPPATILDLCTGSGCIAIALAYAFEQAQVDAVDISDDALQVADINITEHELSDRVFPIQSDLYGALTGHTYDLIVTNPPYVDAEDMDSLPVEFEHEPELGLAAGEDGLDLVDAILKGAVSQLTANGWLFVEVGNSQVHMEARYPGLALNWIDFEHGGHGVFAVSRQVLADYFAETL